MPWVQHVRKNEATAAKRRMFFHCVDATDGYTPKTGEATEQPEISIDGAAWTSSGIGTLTAIGNGDYYADVTQATVNYNWRLIRARYKSAATREARAENVLLVGGSLHEAIAAVTNKTVYDSSDGSIDVMEADGTTLCFTFTDSGVSGTEHTYTR